MKQIEFKGKGVEYFKIWIVNVLLCIITIGIYYPWAKVRTRRYFYANTEYADRFFDYHATGKQLFLGYLIGVAILIVLQVVANVFPIMGMILPLVLFALLPWIIWRSLKFNMRMTSFSNVRFGFIGELKRSYVVHLLVPLLGYGLAALILFGTIGLLASSDDGNPSMNAVNLIVLLASTVLAIGVAVYTTGLFNKNASEYQIGHTTFGQGRFFINIGTRKFISIALKTALINIGFFLIILIICGAVFASLFSGGLDLGSLSNDPNLDMVSPLYIVAFLVLYFGFIAASVFTAAYAYSRKRQYLFANTTLDKAVTFKSTVTAKGYFYVLFTNMLLVMLTLGLALPWSKVRVARYIADNTWLEAENVDINNYLTQKEQEQSAIGEEIGDVLDLDIDIAI